MRPCLKEIALFSCLTLATTANVRAQGTALGVRLGVNRANVSATDFGQGVAARTGVVGGLFLSVAQPGRLIVQPELLYSQQGFASLVRGGTATVKLDYIDVPLLFKIRLSQQSRRLRPAAILGTYVAFEIACSLSGDVGEIGGSDCESQLANHGEMDAGIILGGGVDYGLVGRAFLTTDIRYVHGLLNLDWEDTEDRKSTRMWTFMVGVGLLLGR